MNDMLYEIDGNMGKTLQVYEDRCVISSKASLKSAFFGHALDGNKEFYYKDLTSVQFKNLGMTTGFLQFEFAGAQGGNSNFVNENSFTFSATFASIDKGTRGSAGRKCPHTASKPLRIHKVFSAAFSLSASISAPAELLRIGQPWIFEGFLFFWTQAGCRPPRRKGQKAPKRLAVRRVCSC